MRFRTITVLGLVALSSAISPLAADPRAANPSVGSTDTALAEAIENARRTYWAFQPVKDHSPPAVKDSAWPLNAIDQFIFVRLEEKGLKPVAVADKRTLIRRATFDLTGLPPAPEAVDAFL